MKIRAAGKRVLIFWIAFNLLYWFSALIALRLETRESDQAANLAEKICKFFWNPIDPNSGNYNFSFLINLEANLFIFGLFFGLSSFLITKRGNGSD